MPAAKPTILVTSMGFNRARDPWRLSAIFRYEFDLTGNSTHPKLCFLATGTGDRKGSIDRFYSAFKGGSVDVSHVSFFEKPNVDGLRFLPYSNAVHYGERREFFHQNIASGIIPDGHATDAGAGLHYEGTDLITAVADRKGARAFAVTRQSANGGVREEPLQVRYLT